MPSNDDISGLMESSTKKSMIKSLDDFLRETDLGSMKQQMGNALRGLNPTDTEIIVGKSYERNGLVFFTRPDLNLSDSNIAKDTKYFNLGVKIRNHIYRYIRVMLSPRLQEDTDYNKKVETDLVDPKMPFIPILTSAVKSLSGWPDPVSPIKTTAKGIRGEEMSYVSGNNDIYYNFNLNVVFRNLLGDPILRLFKTWTDYASDVYEGKLIRFLDNIVTNTKDYDTRIYVFTFLPHTYKIAKAANVGAAFPISLPWGKYFDYDKEKPYQNSASDDIPITFACSGAEYMNSEALDDFNLLMATFHPDLAEYYKTGKVPDTLVKVDPEHELIYRYRVYPFINLSTMEMEWYTSKEYYDGVNESDTIDDQEPDGVPEDQYEGVRE